MLIDGLLYECYFVILIVMVVMRGCVVLDGYVYIYIRIYIYLVGGLEHFLFFHMLGTIIPTD